MKLRQAARFFSAKREAKGFTLVELLVVIAIIAILAAVVVLIINPIELTKRSRDAARLTDLANLQQAINVAAQEATASGQDILCATGWDAAASNCQGDSKTDGRSSNGSGWVRVNLSATKSVSVPTLPIDPINDDAHKYTYYSNGSAWEINAVLESDQQKGKMGTDGGDNIDKFEVGSNLELVQ